MIIMIQIITTASRINVLLCHKNYASMFVFRFTPDYLTLPFKKAIFTLKFVLFIYVVCFSDSDQVYIW